MVGMTGTLMKDIFLADAVISSMFKLFCCMVKEQVGAVDD